LKEWDSNDHQFGLKKKNLQKWKNRKKNKKEEGKMREKVFPI